MEPCGVCVIQIPYGGSPAATQDGMPMKNSTLRSKTCEPSRCSRIARFVSRVIQFRRPISSRGPQGLFETLTPPLFRIASGTSSLSRAIDSSLGLDRLCLLDQGAVELRPAVAEEGELVLPRNDVILVARLLDVDLGDDQRLLRCPRLCPARSARVDDPAPAA